MTMEELVIAVRVTAENAQDELDAISGGLKEIGRAGEAGITAVNRQMDKLHSQLGLTCGAVSDVVCEVQAAAQTAEQIGGDMYAFVNAFIAHRRHMGQMSAQEEIAALAHVRSAYAVTAEQIMQMDEKIHDAREKLRSDEAQKLTTLHSALTDALGARYAQQREEEKRRIAASMADWRAWSEAGVAAIQQQMDALEAQEEKESRDKTQAEHLHTIASLEQALAFERDAYNRSQLEKQLQQAVEAWEEVQRGWQKADQRDALSAQMESVVQQANAQIELLEAESVRIDAVYDKLLSGQSLAAEAQKLLMESTQEDLLALLAAYAPDYEATGRTLGEKIYEGFQSAFGDISTWFAQVDAQFEQMTEAAQQAALTSVQGIRQSGAAYAQTGGATISQTVNFNQPVESPADVTRRMQQVSEALAAML